MWENVNKTSNMTSKMPKNASKMSKTASKMPKNDEHISLYGSF